MSSRSPRRAEPANRALGPRVSPISVIAVTDFPDPDSPTMAMTSPRSSVNVTPSTARTTPSSVTNDTCSSFTSSRRSAIRGRLRGQPLSPGEPDARVQHGVENIDDRAEDNDEERGEDGADQDRGNVEVADRARLELPDAGKVEDGLGDQRRPAEQQREVQAEQGHDRHQRVTQHVADEHATL